MLDNIIEGLRWIVWGFTSACLKLMDICYGLCKDIATADFLSDSQVWNWYSVLMLFLGVIILVRTMSIFIKFSFDEDFREKVTAAHFINKFITISLVISLLPTCLSFISQVSTWGIKNISMVVGTEASALPSTLVVTAFMNTDNGEFNSNGDWISGNKVTYKIEDIDINAEGTGDKDFKFFNEISDLFIIMLIGITTSLMMIINAIQIGKRTYSIVMKLIIAPIPISSIIIPGDETFNMWRKMIVSDYLLNYVQTLMIIIVMVLSGSNVLQNLSVWAQIISLMAGLLLLLSGIPELAKIVGGDTSQASILQQVASFRMATRGVGHTIGSGVGSVAHVAGGAGAGVTYGLGRMSGGKSIKEMNNTKTKQSNGFMGGNQFSENNSNAYQTGAYQKNHASNSSTSSNDPFSDNSTFPTNSVKDFQNMHENSSNFDNVTSQFGQHSNIQSSNNQTMDHNVNGDIHKEGNTNTDFKNLNAGNASSYNNKQSMGYSSNSKSSSSTTTQTSAQINPANERRSRDGTFARSISDKANIANGARGFAARLAVNGSRHIYQNSMQRMQATSMYRAGSAIKGFGTKRNLEDLEGKRVVTPRGKEDDI